MLGMVFACLVVLCTQSTSSLTYLFVRAERVTWLSRRVFRDRTACMYYCCTTVLWLSGSTTQQYYSTVVVVVVV